ncbi:MAG TPA: hypothetical protein VGC97_04445 [Pyrinomonadaceae bacterium]|jgi:hypothetical protein
MADNQQNSKQGTQTKNHRSLAENIGISQNLEDFGGGRGQAAGVQESVSSQDQFSEDVTQIVDENDFEGKVTPGEPTDYYDREEDRG